MKKKVTAREFLHHFASLEKDLQPGESLTVTRRGEPIGRFTKEVEPARIPLPDFEEKANRAGFQPAVGDELLKRILQDETVS